MILPPRTSRASVRKTACAASSASAWFLMTRKHVAMTAGRCSLTISSKASSLPVFAKSESNSAEAGEGGAAGMLLAAIEMVESRKTWPGEFVRSAI